MGCLSFNFEYLGVVSTNILPSFRADYSSKEGAVETSISEIFGGKSLDITLSVVFFSVTTGRSEWTIFFLKK